MAINKKLIHFKNKENFDTEVANGNILDTSIVFIKDTKQIYTHGQLYSCSYTESLLLELLNNKADTADLTDILTQAAEYTDDKIANLVGLAPEALDTVYELAEAMATNLDAVDILNEAIGKKVDKVTGKGLSTNDYTTAEKDKLAGIAPGATANLGTITGIKMNGTSKGISGVVDLGTVLTEHLNISHLASKEELNSGLLSKQDSLTSGTTIKTINGESILGSGNIVINSSSEETTINNGVYAVDADGKLIDYNIADESCLGVALVAGEHKFMITKYTTYVGNNRYFYWNGGHADLSLTNYSNADGTNSKGYLPKPDGTYQSTPHLSNDYTTWTSGALSDFNGKSNTVVIAGASSHARDMCTVLNTFNASDTYNDWYVPALGQLALIYLNMTEINTALAKIRGDELVRDYYWSSTEYSSENAWNIFFQSGYVYDHSKSYDHGFVRFIRDISIPKSLKERVSDLESKTCIKFTNKTANAWIEDPTYSDFKYKCDISCEGVTTDMYAEVVFNVDQAISGNYSPVCETSNGIVTIWSSVTDSITIPTIIITE